MTSAMMRGLGFSNDWKDAGSTSWQFKVTSSHSQYRRIFSNIPTDKTYPESFFLYCPILIW